MGSRGQDHHRMGIEDSMDNEMVRRLIWAGLLAATGALASVAAHKASVAIWYRVFNEEPPE
ncbi:MAG: hypothetical protein ACR2G3_09900 [Solirubrobacterales bacterium]